MKVKIWRGKRNQLEYFVTKGIVKGTTELKLLITLNKNYYGRKRISLRNDLVTIDGVYGDNLEIGFSEVQKSALFNGILDVFQNKTIYIFKENYDLFLSVNEVLPNIVQKEFLYNIPSVEIKLDDESFGSLALSFIDSMYAYPIQIYKQDFVKLRKYFIAAGFMYTDAINKYVFCSEINELNHNSVLSLGDIDINIEDILVYENLFNISYECLNIVQIKDKEVRIGVQVMDKLLQTKPLQFTPSDEIDNVAVESILHQQDNDFYTNFASYIYPILIFIIFCGCCCFLAVCVCLKRKRRQLNDQEEKQELIHNSIK